MLTRSRPIPDPQDELNALEARIQAAKPKPPPELSIPGESMGMGLRMGIELLAGIATGTGLGWAIDWAAGTAPWFLIIGLLLGAAAGFLNLVRAAANIGNPPR